MPSDLTPIGEAARLLGCAPSALRYYERRGLVRPATDHTGRRLYDREQLRRIAFVRFGQQLGTSLERIGSLLDGTGDWRALIDAQVAALDEQIDRAERAKRLLAEARDCPASHPFSECPHLQSTLDAALDRGVSEVMPKAGGHTECSSSPPR